MLNKKAQAFLQQYKTLHVRAQIRLERVEFWQAYNEAFCEELITEARNLLNLANDISETIKSANILEQYKTFLHLRFIEGLTLQEVSIAMNLTRRWVCTVQARALQAFGEQMRLTYDK